MKTTFSEVRTEKREFSCEISQTVNGITFFVAKDHTGRVTGGRVQLKNIEGERLAKSIVEMMPSKESSCGVSVSSKQLTYFRWSNDLKDIDYTKEHNRTINEHLALHRITKEMAINTLNRLRQVGVK